MAKQKRGRDLRNWKSNRPQATAGKLRIIGGRFRGRQIEYSGDPVTRPMKDNIREAVFNLVGGWVPGKAVFDLFAGTGAIGIEALSRGATQAFLVERHIPTVRIISSNVRSLDDDLNVDIQSSDTFFWGRQFFQNPAAWPDEPWMVFCCPPYDFFIERWGDLESLLLPFLENAPAESIFVVESDARFDTNQLPMASRWNRREYVPAVVSVLRLDDSDEKDSDPEKSAELNS